MDVVYERCCGMDIHKRTIVACFRDSTGTNIRKFGTTTVELRALAQWLLGANCQMIAMESTGTYWKPIFNVLELLGLDAMIVNAQHMKTVPGRKTDKNDAEWIADLLRHGLLKASFVPDKAQRELREVSRYRKSLTEERTREINRLEKTLEGANFKLSSIVSELTGKSSRALIEAFITQGISDHGIDSMLFGSLRHKRDELLLACDGVITLIQKKLVHAILDHIDDMSRRIADLDRLIDEEMQQYEDAIRRLDQIPGIGPTTAQCILAEIGLSMERFPTAAHLASWCGLCPGNNESAGRRKSGRTRHGNSAVKTTLVQCAKSAAKVKGSFLKAQYDRLVVRRGANRASVAVAHSMIIAIYHMLKDQTSFRDLGADYYSHMQEAQRKRKLAYHLKTLASLGWTPPASSPG